MKTRGSWNPDGEGNQSVLWQWLNTAQSKGRAAGSSWDSETTALLGQGHCSEQCSLKTTNTFKIANGSRDSSSPTLQKCPLGTMDAIDTSLVWDFLWDWHQKVAPQRFPTSMESAQETPRRSFHTGPVKGRGAEALSFLLGIFLPAESE